MVIQALSTGLRQHNLSSDIGRVWRVRGEAVRILAERVSMDFAAEARGRTCLLVIIAGMGALSAAAMSASRFELGCCG